MKKHSPKLLRLLLDYSATTGTITFLKRPPLLFGETSKNVNLCALWNAKYADKPAFATVKPDGRLIGTLLGKKYLAHRIAWAIYYGEWSEDPIRHINCDYGDNRIVNLIPDAPLQDATGKFIRSPR